MIEIIGLIFDFFRIWFPALLLIGFCLFLLVPFAKFGIRHERKLLNPFMLFVVLGLSGTLLYFGYRVGGAVVLIAYSGFWLVMLLVKEGWSFASSSAGRIWAFGAAFMFAFFFVTDMASVPHRKFMALQKRAERVQAAEAASKEPTPEVEAATDQLWK